MLVLLTVSDSRIKSRVQVIVNPDRCNVTVGIQQRAKVVVSFLNREINYFISARANHAGPEIHSGIGNNRVLVQLLGRVNGVLVCKAKNKEAVLAAVVLANDWNNWVALFAEPLNGVLVELYVFFVRELGVVGVLAGKHAEPLCLNEIVNLFVAEIRVPKSLDLMKNPLEVVARVWVWYAEQRADPVLLVNSGPASSDPRCGSAVRVGPQVLVGFRQVRNSANQVTVLFGRGRLTTENTGNKVNELLHKAALAFVGKPHQVVPESLRSVIVRDHFACPVNVAERFVWFYSALKSVPKIIRNIVAVDLGCSLRELRAQRKDSFSDLLLELVLWVCKDSVGNSVAQLVEQRAKGALAVVACEVNNYRVALRQIGSCHFQVVRQASNSNRNRVRAEPKKFLGGLSVLLVCSGLSNILEDRFNVSAGSNSVLFNLVNITRAQRGDMVCARNAVLNRFGFLANQVLEQGLWVVAVALQVLHGAGSLLRAKGF